MAYCRLQDCCCCGSAARSVWFALIIDGRVAAEEDLGHHSDQGGYQVPVREVPGRFAVAFSLAGEQRQLVLTVAQEVEAVLGRSTVFYDDWYTHWIAGPDADLLLQSIYRERAEL